MVESFGRKEHVEIEKIKSLATFGFEEFLCNDLAKSFINKEEQGVQYVGT